MMINYKAKCFEAMIIHNGVDQVKLYGDGEFGDILSALSLKGKS